MILHLVFPPLGIWMIKKVTMSFPACVTRATVAKAVCWPARLPWSGSEVSYSGTSCHLSVSCAADASGWAPCGLVWQPEGSQQASTDQHYWTKLQCSQWFWSVCLCIFIHTYIHVYVCVEAVRSKNSPVKSLLCACCQKISMPSVVVLCPSVIHCLLNPLQSFESFSFLFSSHWDSIVSQSWRN